MKLRGVVVVEDHVPSRLSQDRTRMPALEQVANRPILEHVLDALHLGGVEEVVVAASSAVAGDIRKRSRSCPRDEMAIRYLERDGPLDVAPARSDWRRRSLGMRRASSIAALDCLTSRWRASYTDCAARPMRFSSCIRWQVPRST